MEFPKSVVLAATGLFLSHGPAVAQFPHTDSRNTGKWVLNQGVSDEFSGDELDTDKWLVQGANGHYENGFQGRAPSQFAPENIHVGDGVLAIATRWDPGFPFSDRTHDGRNYQNITTGAIISKSKFLYGYMEIRCKAADGPISSAFWTTGEGGELDVFEHWGRNPSKPHAERRLHTSLHDWRNPRSPDYGKRIWTNDHLLDFRVAGGFHVYAVEWDPNYLRIYADGRLIRHVTREEVGDAWVITSSQKVWLDSESFPWEVNPDTLSASDFPGDGCKFVVDYVRIWQRGAPGADRVRQKNLISNPDFETGADGWSLFGAAAATNAHGVGGGHSLYLAATGRVEQAVSVKPDTVYILSARAQVPGTNMENTWHNAELGVRGHGSEEVRYLFFRPDYYRGSLQFRTGPDTTTATVFFTNDRSGHAAHADHFKLVEAPLLGDGAGPAMQESRVP